MRIDEQTKRVLPKMAHALVLACVDKVNREYFTPNFSSKKNTITFSKN